MRVFLSHICGLDQNKWLWWHQCFFGGGNIQSKVNRNPLVLCTLCAFEYWTSFVTKRSCIWNMLSRNSWLQAPWRGFSVELVSVFIKKCLHQKSICVLNLWTQCRRLVVWIFPDSSFLFLWHYAALYTLPQCRDNKHDTGNSSVLRFSYQVVSFCVLIVIRSLNWKIRWDISCKVGLHVFSLWKKIFGERVWKKKWKV